MEYYPIFLNLKERSCTVVGGGRVAERKVKGLLACDARVTVISPELGPGLAVICEQGGITWLERTFRKGDLAEVFLVIAATDDTGVQQLVHQEAIQRNILLNVADVPDLCGFILPATHRQGDLAISVSTGGKSPALARQLRLELEKRFGPEYKVMVDILGALRPAVLAASQVQADNEAIFNRLLHRDMPDWIREKDWGRVEGHIESVLGEVLTPAVKDNLKALIYEPIA